MSSSSAPVGQPAPSVALARVVVTALVALGAGLLLAMSTDLTGSARWYAFTILGALTLLSAVHCISMWRADRAGSARTTDDPMGTTSAVADGTPATAARPWGLPEVLRTFGFIALWVAYPFTWALVGFVIPTAAAVLTSLVLLGNRRFVLAAAASGAAAVGIYWLLVGVLEVAVAVTGVETTLNAVLPGM